MRTTNLQEVRRATAIIVLIVLLACGGLVVCSAQEQPKNKLTDALFKRVSAEAMRLTLEETKAELDEIENRFSKAVAEAHSAFERQYSVELKALHREDLEDIYKPLIRHYYENKTIIVYYRSTSECNCKCHTQLLRRKKAAQRNAHRGQHRDCAKWLRVELK